ncbi:MAG TPA: DUF447 domain-containing protein [Burkholderiales bacterium]|nr:DUF447 domain-containing protein [Burkholderiales bacterium]
MIFETIVTTRDESGRDHIAPMGIRHDGEFIVLSPFRPSATLEHVLREKCAIVNYTDDVRIFAGCLTGRYDWPTLAVESLSCRRLAAALAHSEVRLERVQDDPTRPRLFCREIAHAVHGTFGGFNRAQSAVIEAAILVSRLNMLPREKVDAEMAYLAIGIEKTAGPRELEAWGWLKARIDEFHGTRRDSAA